MNRKRPLTYRDAGVDIDAGDALVERIAPLAERTRRDGVLSGIGGFGGLFELPRGYREPVLVAGTDGVGTKLKLAIELDRHDTVGIDLVAMCANDVVVQGAEPLFFLDYYATSRLNVDVAESVVRGIARGCELAGAALLGGETAEMPGMYAASDYDLAGFCVGIVEKTAIIDGRRVAAGDALIGLASSGPHANGYSLIRKVLETTGTDPAVPVGGRPLADLLMEPTRIYVRPILELIAGIEVHALAHVTGGGIVENLPRVLPAGLEARIDASSWPRPPVFAWLQEAGDIADTEMWRTFNCGIGMLICIARRDVDAALDLLGRLEESPRLIGTVASGDRGVVLRT
ncbi:MAG TPA: phosphoribosylformylglycinamidine cyclo-ligase [Gammaproteobacteria bacterium]|nr:phosphoribosylformylglycinamidine cyclo-ligase [Gammaproteobacteria bacterium]